MFRNLLAYADALWCDLVARVSGIASAAFTTWQVYSDFFNGSKGSDHARWYWWVAAAFCFLVANYRVWLDEHKKLISQTPQFIVFPEHVDWEYSELHRETMLIVAVSLVNRGAPSAARFWRGSLIVGLGRDELKPITLTDQWILSDPAGKNPIVLSPQDQITWKTVNGAVGTGESKTGRLFFSSAGDQRPLLISLNWKLEIKCEDSFGNPFTGTLTPSPSAVVERKAFPGEKALSPELIQELLKTNDRQIPRRTKRAKAI